MSKIKELAASSQETIPLSYVPQNIVVADVTTVNVASFLQISVDGDNFISITATARIVAFMQLGKQLLGGATSVLGSMIQVATGRIAKACNIIITNAQASTQDVYANSLQHSNPAKKNSGTVVTAGEQTINALDQRDFSGFAYLCFDPTNLDYAIIESLDGSFTDNVTAVELDAMNAAVNPTDANGRTNGLTTIDARKLGLKSVKLQTNSGGQMTVLVVGIGTV